jgi:hypothetical protein
MEFTTIEIVSGIVIAVFSALLTYFVKSVVDRNMITSAISARIWQHEREYHKQEAWDIAKQAVREHLTSCSAIKDISVIAGKIESLENANTAIKMAISYLVKINDGNPSEFGL